MRGGCFGVTCLIVRFLKRPEPAEDVSAITGVGDEGPRAYRGQQIPCWNDRKKDKDECRRGSSWVDR
jgi:hypothetical protein